MKKVLLLLFGILLIGSNAFLMAQNKSKSKKGSVDKVDYRIDNMGYWLKMADIGMVPYNQVIPIPAEEYKGSVIKTSDGITIADSPDVPVSNATNLTESENSVFVDPNDNQYVLNSNNSTSWSGSSVGTLYGANYFQTANGGLTWGGSYQGAGGSNSGDPTTAISLNGREYVNFISSSGGQGIAYSDNGSSWSTSSVAPNPGSLADKNHMWIDNSPTSPYEGNLYVAWTAFGGTNDNNVVISRSTDNGVTWSSPVNISSAVNAGSHNQGVNIQTGPNGEVYVVWAIYDGWPTNETALGFSKSTNGGASWSTATRIISNINGIRTSGTSKNHRVNSFPSMGVDISGGTFDGNIYVVWANYGDPNNGNTGSNISVYMIRSANGGSSWTSPIRVNQGPFQDGKESYFPWITCDPETGNLGVIFYDDRNTSSTSCETWVAYSVDAGSNWLDFRVSDVAFTPTPIPGLASSYMGDYLGITSRGNRFYPCWTDTRNGLFMTYVSPFELGLNASFNADNTLICSGGSVNFTDLSSGPPTSWNWSFPGGNPASYNGQNPPPITYNTAGTYDVTLVVGDGTGTDTEIKTGYITVQNVIADFTGTPTTVVVGNSVTFTDNSSCNPTSWTWSFPGGTPSSFTGQNPPPVTYNTEGTYNVTLSVTNASGNDTEIKTGYITVVPPEFNMTNGTITTCQGNFYDSGGPSSNYGNNETFVETFYPSTSGSMIRFTFNSFSTESGYDYFYIYNGENTSAPLIGTYNGTTSPGTVTASNAAGALTFRFTSDGSVTSSGWSASISCYSTTSPPVADFSASTTNPAINTDVIFTDQSMNFPTSWSWSFTPNNVVYVNGTNASSQNPQVQFTVNGLYTVSLTATNTYGSDVETKVDYINVTNCSYCASNSNNATEEWISNVTFNTINNTSGGSVGYEDYTSISTDVDPGNTYNLSITCDQIDGFTENIWAFFDWNQNCDFTDAGESYDLGQVSGPATVSLNITVPANALAGTTRMRASLKYNADPTSCEIFSYGQVEDYTVNVGGTTGPPVADFAATNTIPFFGETVQFTDQSANAPTSWQWAFNPSTVTFVGGTDATSQNPQVQFDVAGYYSVTLTATNIYGNDSQTKADYIHAVDPIPPYVDGFEGFNSGDFLAVESPYWTTWSDLPGSGEDNIIVTNQAHTGNNSVKVDGTSDMVLPLGDKTSGKYMVSFYMYIPSGYFGYYNLLQLFNGASSEWGCEVFFDAGGLGTGSAGGTNAFSFSYAYDTWNYVENIVDLDNDVAEIWFNGNFLYQWQWSTGAQGTGTLNQLGGVDMFAWNTNGTPLFYFDDFLYRELFPLDLSVKLEGPYMPGSGMMSTDLNTANLLPLSQPFNAAPWNYNGTESVAAIPDPSITDWVLLGFRDAASPGSATGTTAIGRMAAFVKADGQIVDINNNPLIDFRMPYYQNLYVVVYHSNHLSIMSNYGLMPTGGAYTYDFSSGSGQAYGGVNAQKELSPGVWGMIGGDGDQNGQVGTSDKAATWETQAGTRGYISTDYNRDGESNNIDKDDYWYPNIGAGTQIPN